MRSDSFTNVSFPHEKRDLLRSAVEHYEFGNPTNFFRICGLLLIEAYEEDAALDRPLRFRKNGVFIAELQQLYAKDKTQKTTHQNETET